MLCEPYYSRQQENNEENIDDIKLVDSSKMIRRNTPACIRVPHFVATTDPEGYFYSLLLQYKPYRNEDELLEGFNTAREVFLAQEQQLKQMSAHMELYHERDRQLENAFK